MTIQPVVFCACGNPKARKFSVLFCAHCDNPCLRPAGTCSFCKAMGKVKP